MVGGLDVSEEEGSGLLTLICFKQLLVETR